ncbi:MAG: putative sigma-54 modulation protein [Bacillota bacterium]|nr:MAG: putative sigma-54 modulation protein [Bacillota bacterium]MBS3950992.1 ribosome-associated translation inhibitor RaiA [Peptococcaceae bacterium]
MQISVRGKNVDVTDALRDYVFKKLKRLDRYFDGAGDGQVTLSVERDQHRVEVTIIVNGLLLRGEELSPDMYASIDLVTDKLEKQVDRYRTKIARRLRSTVPQHTIAVDAPGEDDEPQIVRTKRFPMKPMNIEEAVLQMNLLGHDFFVFNNSDTELVNVVYKRKDGNFGLIEPQL